MKPTLLLSLLLVSVVFGQHRPPPGGGGPQRPPPEGQQPGGGGNHNTCSNTVAHFRTPSATNECPSFSAGHSYSYPDGFSPAHPSHQWYECENDNVRLLVSKGLPNHDVRVNNPNSPCAIPWYIRLPLDPQYTNELTEPANLGVVAIQLNGVGIYGAQEAGGSNAVEPQSSGGVQDAQYWYGHTAPTKDWHYHNPMAGHPFMPSSETLIGFALDGFPIYGALNDPSVLDECNGIEVNGKYQYHVRTIDQVDGKASYCNGNSPAIQWNYVIGCYHGSLDRTEILSSQNALIPKSCVEVNYSAGLRNVSRI